MAGQKVLELRLGLRIVVVGLGLILVLVQSASVIVNTTVGSGLGKVGLTHTRGARTAAQEADGRLGVAHGRPNSSRRRLEAPLPSCGEECGEWSV